MNEEEKQWLETFLSRSDVTYTNPGRKDHVYVGKIDGERRYKQRLYLLWTLRDLLDIANGSGKVDVSESFYQNFEKLLMFSQLYNFLKYHKEYCYNQNIPHGSCLCEICENCVLLPKGLNNRLQRPLPTNPHDLIERFSSNLEEINCVIGRCPICRVAEIDLEKQPSDDDSCDSADGNTSDQVIYFTWKKIEKRVTKAQLSVSFDDAVCTFKNQIKVLKEHIFIKRVQSNAYDIHKAELSDDDLLVHVDFAESYRNDQ